MGEMYNVSSNPHIRDKMTTSHIIRNLEFWSSCTPGSVGYRSLQCVL